VLGAITDINLHAIAIDEHRRPFEAAAWTKPKFASYGKERVVEQVWFPGTHSDVGGGYPRHGESTPALEDIALEGGVSGFRQLTRLELHLAVEQDFTQASFIVHLGIGRFRDLVEHEPETADQERIEQEHAQDAAGNVPAQALSSLRRMLTKL